MPEYSDIYVISSRRNQKDAESFLDAFLPQRAPAADEYEFPQYADKPLQVFHAAQAILQIAEKDIALEYNLYWRSVGGGKPEHAMISFLKDGNVIYGLSTDAAFPVFAQDLLNRMKSFFGTGLGYIGHEASPDAETMEEFLVEIENHS